MRKDESIAIERTANGYQVRLLSGNGNMICISEIMVFQTMGYASGPGDGIKTDDTLLGFIANHFTEGNKNEQRL